MSIVTITAVALSILRAVVAGIRAGAEEERDTAAKARDAGVSPDEYLDRQAEIELGWARRGCGHG